MFFVPECNLARAIVQTRREVLLIEQTPENNRHSWNIFPWKLLSRCQCNWVPLSKDLIVNCASFSHETLIYRLMSHYCVRCRAARYQVNDNSLAIEIPWINVHCLHESIVDAAVINTFNPSMFAKIDWKFHARVPLSTAVFVHSKFGLIENNCAMNLSLKLNRPP